MLKKNIYKLIGFFLLIFFDLDSSVFMENFEEEEKNQNQNQPGATNSWYNWFKNHKIEIFFLSLMFTIIIINILNGDSSDSSDILDSSDSSDILDSPYAPDILDSPYAPDILDSPYAPDILDSLYSLYSKPPEEPLYTLHNLDSADTPILNFTPTIKLTEDSYKFLEHINNNEQIDNKSLWNENLVTEITEITGIIDQTNYFNFDYNYLLSIVKSLEILLPHPEFSYLYEIIIKLETGKLVLTEEEFTKIFLDEKILQKINMPTSYIYTINCLKDNIKKE